MPTVSRNIPDRPHIDVPRRQARELLGAWRRRERRTHAPLPCRRARGAVARRRGVRMTRRLLDAGASPSVRTTLRQYLDWRETPGWHEARGVTAIEWATSFPEEGWTNGDAMRLIDPAVDSAC